MFCANCGQHFPSRGYLLAHLCKGQKLLEDTPEKCIVYTETTNALNNHFCDEFFGRDIDQPNENQQVIENVTFLNHSDLEGGFNNTLEDLERYESSSLNINKEQTKEIIIEEVYTTPIIEKEQNSWGNEVNPALNINTSTLTFNNKEPNEVNVNEEDAVLPLPSEMDFEINDDSDEDPTWCPEDKCNLGREMRTQRIIKKIASSGTVGEELIENEHEFQEDVEEDITRDPNLNINDFRQEIRMQARKTESENERNTTTREDTDSENEENPSTREDTESENEENTTTSNKKRKKGVRKREEERKKKISGLAYTNRRGILVPAKQCNPIMQCCKKKCFELCDANTQEIIFSNFITKPPEVRKQVLCDRMTISQCKIHCKGRGTKGGKPHDRKISVGYKIVVGTEQFDVCKEFFIKLHGISKNQVNLLVKKLNLSQDGLVETDLRGKHAPANKIFHERQDMLEFIKRYPRHESHYSRRDNDGKIFLPSHLNMRKMYAEYNAERLAAGITKIAGYDIFRQVFNATGYKFKAPYIDTCRKCDEYKTLRKNATSNDEKERLKQLHDDHVGEADKAYENKRADKEEAKEDDGKRVLVFDLQQVLPAPYLATNVVYYKRVLSVFNLTIRDCSASTDTSSCFMWHEAIGGRGSEQIASCVFKKIMSLPDTVHHIITYSDTCGGQNRNINMAVMFFYTIQKKTSVEVIDQKFLLPGHTRLECDSDHARIERSKKQIHDNFKIMIPRDWSQFIRMLKGKKMFNVVDMAQEDFLAFSKLLKNILVKRTSDTNGEKVNWLNIKWMRFTKEFGTMYFKYTLEKDAPFKILDLKRGKARGRQLNLNNMNVPLSYTGPLGINPLKKKDLLSMLPLIDSDCHGFYQDLPTTDRAPEFVELEDNHDSDSDE